MIYRFFDSWLDSDVALPELESDRRGHATLLLRRCGSGQPRSMNWLRSIEDGAGSPWLRIGSSGDGSFVLRFRNTLHLACSPGRVEWRCSRSLGGDAFRHTLLDQALPLVAAHQGRLVLHAACAIHDGRALVFAGPAGAGKSTLAASLLGDGWTCSDDAVSLSVSGDAVLACPSYGGLRLWGDSTAALGVNGATLPSGKRRLPASPLPRRGPRVQAIYVLSRRRGSVPCVRALSGRDALLALLRNTYVLDPADRVRAAAQFAALSAVVARLRVRSLSVPHRFELLDTVRARIEDESDA